MDDCELRIETGLSKSAIVNLKFLMRRSVMLFAVAVLFVMIVVRHGLAQIDYLKHDEDERLH